MAGALGIDCAFVPLFPSMHATLPLHATHYRTVCPSLPAASISRWTNHQRLLQRSLIAIQQQREPQQTEMQQQQQQRAGREGGAPQSREAEHTTWLKKETAPPQCKDLEQRLLAEHVAEQETAPPQCKELERRLLAGQWAGPQQQQGEAEQQRTGGLGEQSQLEKGEASDAHREKNRMAARWGAKRVV